MNPRWRSFDLFALMAGFLFAALGVAFLLDATGTASVDARLVPPAVFIALGLGAVLSGLRAQSDWRSDSGS